MSDPLDWLEGDVAPWAKVNERFADIESAGGSGPQTLAYYGDLGTADDAATWQAAIDSGEPFINARGVVSTIASQVDMASGVTIDMTGAEITMAAGNFNMFDCDTVDDWGLVGGATITGPGASSGTAKAIRVDGCNRYRVSDHLFKGINGHACYLEPGTPSGGTTNRADQGRWTNLQAVNCRYGWEDTPGTGAEYCQVNGFSSSGHTGWGVKTCAGNINWTNVNCVDGSGSGKGFLMAGGSNHAHGIVTNLQANHNPGGNLELTGIVNGETFVGQHVYEQGLLLDGCKGVEFVGGVLDCDIVVNSGTGSGDNYLIGCFCPGDYGVIGLSGTDPSTLVRKGLWGAGSLGNNDLRLRSKSADYTFIMDDEGACHPSADTSTRTWTIPSNASVPYPIGKALAFTNEDGAGDITIAITSDTLRDSAGNTGSRTLAENGIAVAVKVAATSWQISGTNLT